MSRSRRKSNPNSLAVAGIIVAGLVFIPLPHRVWGALELEPDGSQQVYAEVPGVLVAVFAKPGTHVEEGTILARLRNIDVELAIAEMAGKRKQYVAQLASLRQRRYEEPSAGLAIQEVQKSLASIEEQLQQKQSQLDRLNLVASRSGTVLPPPEVPRKPSSGDELAGWTGLPQEPRNLGCFLPESTLYCLVGDPHRWTARVVVDQADVPFVQPGQVVHLKLDTLAEETLTGRVEEISQVVVSESPRHLSNKSGGELATKTDAGGVERPISTSYEVRVPLVDPAGHLRIGLRGQAKIVVPWESAATRISRWFRQTFHFRI